MTGDTWQVTRDTWHLTPDTGHMTRAIQGPYVGFGSAAFSLPTPQSRHLRPTGRLCLEDHVPPTGFRLQARSRATTVTIGKILWATIATFCLTISQTAKHQIILLPIFRLFVCDACVAPPQVSGTEQCEMEAIDWLKYILGLQKLRVLHTFSFFLIFKK